MTASQKRIILEIYKRLGNWEEDYSTMCLSAVARKWRRKLENSGLIREAKDGEKAEEAGKVVEKYVQEEGFINLQRYRSHGTANKEINIGVATT